VIVTDKVALDTSFTECQIMYESHRCNDQLMVLKENKYVFDEEPSDSGYWLQTIITEKVNCVLEMCRYINKQKAVNSPHL
jgi:hypothetical protein